MMQVATPEEIIAEARRMFPLDRALGPRTRQQRELIHVLCDELEKRLEPRRPPARTWAQAWKRFGEQMERLGEPYRD